MGKTDNCSYSLAFLIKVQIYACVLFIGLWNGMCGNQNDAPSGRIVGGWAAIVSFILVQNLKLAAKF